MGNSPRLIAAHIKNTISLFIKIKYAHEADNRTFFGKIKYYVVMKICVLTSCNIEGVVLPECDFALFGFACLKEVSYAEELSGRSQKFECLARLSQRANCGILCGCMTDSRGVKRRSVAVAHGGRMLGVADMIGVLDGQNLKGGAYLGVYDIAGYRVGVCIENDVYNPTNISGLCLCGCNIIAAFVGGGWDKMLPAVLSSYAYLYGVPCVLVAKNAAFFFRPDGQIASTNKRLALFESQLANSYRVISSRKRGLFGNFPQE
jgi:hypothetical protein